MKVTFWGTRGSLAAPGPETARYGGNTSCVEVSAGDGTVIVLDAGTGIRRLGEVLPATLARVDLLLSHLHMDHIQGLGFFAPLYQAGTEVHIWGPPSTTLNLRARLNRYLSPPLFPVHLRELPCTLHLHEVTGGRFQIGEVQIDAALVSHPGPTLGYRLAADGATLAYLPDHELDLGGLSLKDDPSWISGFEIAAGADLLIHDAHFTPHEYRSHVGWGHSTYAEAVHLAVLAGTRCLALFHHSPDRDDGEVDRLLAAAQELAPAGLAVSAAAEGWVIELPDGAGQPDSLPISPSMR